MPSGLRSPFSPQSHSARSSGCWLARSLKPASTRWPEQYGQPSPSAARWRGDICHSWPQPPLHQTCLIELNLTPSGLRSPLRPKSHSAASSGCTVTRSLKPRSSLRFLQYGQLSSMRMERMLTFSRQTWPHDPRHHTMAPAWAWRSSARRPPFSSGSSCLATSGLFDPRSLLPLAR